MQSCHEEYFTDKQIKLFQEFVASIGAKNCIINFSPGTAPGENFLGVITEAEVKWHDEEGKNASCYFIIKCAPPGQTFRSLVYVEDVYAREIYIYAKVLQEFSKFQTEKRILTPFKSYPNYYRSMADYGQEMLILENMKNCGFKHWKREQPLDFNHTLLVIQEMGRLHALSYALRDQHQELFQEIAENTKETFFRDFSRKPVHDTVQHRIIKALASLDPVNDKVVYERFLKFTKSLWKPLIDAIHPKTTDEYGVVSHGDCGISNFLFKYEVESSKPKQVCMLDWQMSRLSSPALDITCFLFANTDKQLRDQHYDRLIAEYYKSLQSFLKDLGSDGQKLLPFGVLQQQLKKYSIFGLCLAILVLYVHTSNAQEIPDVFKDESHVDGMSFMYDLKDSTYFNTRTRDAIIDFDRLGYDY